MIVKLTKISGKEGSSIKPGYTVEGPLTSQPEAGQQVKLDGYIRTSLNERFEWFRTTEVIAIDHEFITTKNSVWKLEKIND